MQRDAVVGYLLRVIGRLLSVTSMTKASASRQGAGARLVNLVVDPGAAFRGIADDPSWALAFVAAVGIRFGSLFLFYRPAVTPIRVIAGLLFQVMTIGPTVLLAALIAWLTARAWHVGVAWPTAVSILIHVYVAFTLATVAFASVAGALLPQSVDVDLRNPPFTNLTSLLDGTGPEVFRTLVGEMDVRSAYALVLLWVGLRGAAPEAPRAAIARIILTIACLRVAGVVTVSLLR